MIRSVSLCVIVTAMAGALYAPRLSWADPPSPRQVPSPLRALPPRQASADSAAADLEAVETNLCTEQLIMGDPQSTPSWNGWGNGSANTRFQPKEQGKLTAAELPRLQLKWAFGYSNVTAARSQTTVVAGRLFAPSENGRVYA